MASWCSLAFLFLLWSSFSCLIAKRANHSDRSRLNTPIRIYLLGILFRLEVLVTFSDYGLCGLLAPILSV